MGWSIGSWGGCKFSFPFRSPEGISHAVRAFSLLLAGGALAKRWLSRSHAAGGRYFVSVQPLPKASFRRGRPETKPASLMRCWLLDNHCFAEREGFEPPEPFSSTVFKTAVIDHSTTSPRFVGLFLEQDCKYRYFIWICKGWCEFFVHKLLMGTISRMIRR